MRNRPTVDVLRLQMQDVLGTAIYLWCIACCVIVWDGRPIRRTIMSIQLPITIQRMQANLTVIKGLFSGASDDLARWKPDDNEWSLLEVLGHLCDEEREDFRPRLDIMLNRPGEVWTPIHPSAWVIERGYARADLTDLMATFEAERSRSISWLKTLGTPIWTTAYVRDFNTVTAGDMLTSWLAHDHLHIRQINALHYGWQARNGIPFSPAYAGDW